MSPGSSCPPQFAEHAGPVLDLYERRWEGELLHPGDCVICAAEKTQIQARARVHASSPPAPGQMMRVEHEYERCGALSYLAAWDVHRGRLFGRCETTTGIVPFGRLVEQVMSQDPYKDARRVFWILDNGSRRRGEASRKRLQTAWPNLIVVHTPVHASWLNQMKVIFSIVSRKVPSPNDFASLQAVVDRLDAFKKRTTTRSPNRSTGSSRAKISPRYWPTSTATNHNSASPPDPTNL